MTADAAHDRSGEEVLPREVFIQSPHNTIVSLTDSRQCPAWQSDAADSAALARYRVLGAGAAKRPLCTRGNDTPEQSKVF